MVIKNLEKNLEIKVAFVTNSFVYGAICNKTVTEPKKPTKRDPEENLPDVVSTLDTDKIERGVDYQNIKEYMEVLASHNNITVAEIFENEDLLFNVCKWFDVKIKELLSIIVSTENDIEHDKKESGIIDEKTKNICSLQFLRSVIKPLIARLVSERLYYETNGTKFKPIFNYI